MPAYHPEAIMFKPGAPQSLTLLFIAVLACTLAACKGEKPTTPPPKPTTETSAAPAPARTREQAMASLMAMPEIKTWSAQIEKSSRGKTHGALIEDDPAPRIINGQPYWQLSFVENRPDRAHRVQSFLVAQKSDEVLVEDLESDSMLTLSQWRRSIHKVVIRAGQ
jgi:hypothetical protein